MRKKYFANIFGVAIVIAVCLVVALPSKAFYIELPQIFKEVKAVPSSSGTMLLLAQENTAPQPSTGDQSTGQSQPAPLAPIQPEQPMLFQPPSQSQQTCNINGIEMPGSCEKYNQNNQSQPGQMMGPDNSGNSGGQGQMTGPSPEDQQKMQAQRLKDMQRGAKQMKTNLNRLDLIFKNAEKKGTIIPDEIKQKLEKAKQISATIDSATSADDLENIDMGELGNLVQELEQARQDIVEAAQRMQQVQRGMVGMEKGVKTFEKQVAKLTKQNITVPAEVTDNLNKIKSIITAIKQAKTWDEIETAGLEDVQDLMQSLDQSRQQLEMLSRWPQTIKQLAKDIKQLDSALKRDKSIVDKLLKKGIDLNNIYSRFVDAVNQIKTARDNATNKMKEGDGEEAFNILQDDVFSQMNDVWQHDQVINMMSNLGRFTSDFKRGISQAQSMVKKLQKQKFETSALENLLSQSQTKGQEVLDMMKSGEIDEDVLSAAMEELQNLKQEFDNEIANLTGKEEVMPWEQGQQQFNQINIPSSISNLLPQKTQPTVVQPPMPVPPQEPPQPQTNP